jgi:hypothetical protein
VNSGTVRCTSLIGIHLPKCVRTLRWEALTKAGKGKALTARIGHSKANNDDLNMLKQDFCIRPLGNRFYDEVQMCLRLDQ